MLLPIAVLLIVFILIAARQLGNARLQLLEIKFLKIPLGRVSRIEIWHIMLFGAIAVLLTGQISPIDAVSSENFDVLVFLFCMFIIGQAMDQSGYLFCISRRLFRRAKSPNQLLLFVIFGMGMASAFLMNDTIAIVGTPVMLLLAKSSKLPPKLLLLALAFSVTIGSAMSPMGNPQNLLIALGGGIQNPFVSFFSFLFIPTIINLLIAYIILKYFFRDSLQGAVREIPDEPIKDKSLASLCKISLTLLLILSAAKILLAIVFGFEFRLTYIAIASSLPIIIGSRKRADIAKNIDWKTLVFFASMFILMASVWQAGFIQGIIAGANLDITSVSVILPLSVLMSQLISNVPLVALILPMLTHLGASSHLLVALGAGSTIAGNLFILGAASNIIIIAGAERRSGISITFWEFAKIGIPLTIANVAVYWIFLSVF